MIRVPWSSEEILGIVMAVASLLIAGLHAAGLLETTWVQEQVPIVTLVIAGLVAGYLGFGTTRKLDRITGKLDSMTEQILSALGGAVVRQFKDISKLSAYVRDRMERAHEVGDLTWGPPIQRHIPIHKSAYAKYRKHVTEFGLRKNVLYREVMTFPDSERVDLADETLRKNLPSYQLKYYETPTGDAPPLVRFILIDDEVIFVQHRQAALPAEGVVWLSVRHPQIVELAKVYFAEVWEQARAVDRDGLTRIRAQLNPKPELGATHGT